jgi:alkylated DNA nucleotide flippase Atl1
MQERFVAVIVALGEGEVVSYGDVAEDAGFPGRSRAVGALLSAALLRAEGVLLRGDRVVESPAGRFRR